MRRHHHRGSDASQQEQGTGHVVHCGYVRGDCTAHPQRPDGCSRIDDLSRHDGRSDGPDPRKKRLEGRQRFLRRILAGAGRPQQPELYHRNDSEGCRLDLSRRPCRRRCDLQTDRCENRSGLERQSCRGDKAHGKYFPCRQHRPGQRTESHVYENGDRCVGRD